MQKYCQNTADHGQHKSYFDLIKHFFSKSKFMEKYKNIFFVAKGALFDVYAYTNQNIFFSDTKHRMF
jgi:hypothetical protein